MQAGLAADGKPAGLSLFSRNALGNLARQGVVAILST